MFVSIQYLQIRNINADVLQVIIVPIDPVDVCQRLGLTSSPASKITEQHRRCASSPGGRGVQGNYVFKGFARTFRGRSIQGPGRTGLFAEPVAWLTTAPFCEPFLLCAGLLFLLMDIDSYFGAESFYLLVHLCLPHLFTSEESLFFRVQWR